MRIGIDLHFCRDVQTGVYTYLWNVAARLGRMSPAPSVALVLYGPGDVQEPGSIERMRAHLPSCRIEYFWDGISRRRLPRSSSAGDALWNRFLLATSPRWKRIALLLFGRDPRPAWWNELDVLHHTVGLLLPIHPGANVMTISDLIPRHFGYQYKFQANWFAESYARAKEMDRIIVYSQHTKDDICEVLGLDQARIDVIPLAAHHQYRPIADRAAIDVVLQRHQVDDAPYLLHVGSLEPRKNLVRLVEAFGMMLRRSPELPHRLVMTGPRFSIWQPIFEAIEALGLQSRVRWLGLVPFEDLPALMCGATAFVYPSIYEGFGLPPLEAMACGTPVIAANASSIPEVVGDAALLIDPYRVDDIADAMERVVSDAALRERMRSAGLARAATFDWDRTARLTLEAYASAIESAKRRSSEPAIAPRTAQPDPPARRAANEWLVARYAERAGGS